MTKLFRQAILSNEPRWSSIDEKMTITACILTKDEEKNIGDCITTLARYVDEILILDGCSTDKTVEIAERFKCYLSIPLTVIQKEFSGSFAVERNYLIEKAHGDWIFMLDADEIPSTELLRRLKEFVATTKYDAYSFLRKEVLPGGVMLGFECGYPQLNIKLSKRDKMRFFGAIHERAIVDGQVKFIPEEVYHNRGYTTVDDWREQKRFAEIAKDATNRDQGMEPTKSFLILRGLKIVVRYYFDMLLTLRVGIFKSFSYTLRFAFGGLGKYRRAKQL